MVENALTRMRYYFYVSMLSENPVFRQLTHQPLSATMAPDFSKIMRCYGDFYFFRVLIWFLSVSDCLVS